MFIQSIMNSPGFMKFKHSLHNISTRTHLWSQSWVRWTHPTTSHLIRTVLILFLSNCHCLPLVCSFRYSKKYLICISHITHAYYMLFSLIHCYQIFRTHLFLIYSPYWYLVEFKLTKLKITKFFPSEYSLHCSILKISKSVFFPNMSTMFHTHVEQHL